MYINAMRVRIRSGGWYWPLLAGLWVMLWHLRKTEGFRGAVMQRAPGRVLWALLLWERPAQVHAFRRGGGHRWMMSRLLRLFDEWAAVDWEQADDGVPSWGEVHQRLKARGRFLALAFPSEAHRARDLGAQVPETGRAGLSLAPRRVR
jgi:hypothetical protein